MERFRKLRNLALPGRSDEQFIPTWETTEDVTESLPAQHRARFLQFWEHLNELDNDKLNQFLEKIDSEHRVIKKDVVVSEVVSTVESLVEDIINAVEIFDPRFRASIIKSGSFYDDLKVGEVDEFDFVIRLEALSKNGAFEARRSERKKGFVYLVATDETIKEVFKEFLTFPCIEDDDDCIKDDEQILDVKEFQHHFLDLVSRSIQVVDLPTDLIPVDFSDKEMVEKSLWEPKYHGPCATLYAAYLCQSNNDVINVDIDFAPAIAYPGKMYKPPVIEILSHSRQQNPFLDILNSISNSTEVLLVPFRFDNTEKTHQSAWNYNYSNTWRVSHSNLEKAVFAQYNPLDTEKKLCRVLKVLKEIYIQGSIKTEEDSNSRPLKLQEPPPSRLFGINVEFVGGYSTESESETESDLSIDNNDCTEQIIYGRVKSNPNEIQTDEVIDQPVFDEIDNVETCSSSTDFSESNLSNSRKQEKIIHHSRDEDMHLLSKRSDDDLDANIEGANCIFGETETEKQTKLCGEYQGHASFKDHNFQLCYTGVTTTLPHEQEDHTEIQANKTEKERKLSISPEILYGTCHQKLSRPNEDHESVNSFQGKQSENATISCTDPENSMIKYRDSKPLLKTYLIKMIFLAMKTAFPETASWEQDELAILVKLALSMIYYAYCSEEMGIRNFWFQDLIENRTKESTRVEVLYCLDKIVEHLKQKLRS